MKRKGFTLIELLVVIAIIGLLSTLSVVSLNSARGKARDAARKSDMNSISTALELFNVDSTDGTYPVGGATCAAAETANAGEAILETTNDTICGSAYSLVSDSGDTVLQALPTPPADLEVYTAFASADNYCISADLEQDSDPVAVGDFFKCINGSCYESATACTQAELYTQEDEFRF